MAKSRLRRRDPGSIRSLVGLVRSPRAGGSLVYAEIERRWNKTPPVEIVPPDSNEKHGGSEYQSCCLEILRWLHDKGDITSLKVSEDE